MNQRSDQAFAQAEVLFPAQPLQLINPLVHANAASLDLPTANWLHWCYAPRETQLPDVRLGRYPPGTCLQGHLSFQVLVDGCLVANQTAHPDEDLHATRAALASAGASAIDVDRPCLLACRAGEWCWGHWLLDMLPKIVTAELHSPKRFTFAVPAGIVDPRERPHHAPNYVRSVLGSLAAYGIDPSRLLRIRPNHTYRFDNLFDVSGTSGKHMHPGVLAAMRALPDPGGQTGGSLAVLRARPSIRTLVNAQALRTGLSAAGFDCLDLGAASFTQQVAAFRGSRLIAGDLGSNLAGIIYAQPGTALATLAPLRWPDDYFLKLFQRLDIVVADIRGTSLPEPGQSTGHADYLVHPPDLAAGLQAVAAAQRSGAARTHIGSYLAVRRPGEVLLDVNFSAAAGNADAYACQGFAEPEVRGTWSVGPRSSVRLPPVPGAALLEICGTGFVRPPYLVAKPFAVSLNGERVAEWAVGEAAALFVEIPPHMAHGALLVGFEHPVCPSPKAMGASDDDRALGFQFQTLRVRKA